MTSTKWGRDRDIIRTWWWQQIGARESSAARALAARLNRADAVAVLSERAVFDLGKSLGLLNDPARLVSLSQVLAAVREDRAGPLPRRLGEKQGEGKDAPPLLSPSRFDRLLRSDGGELATQLRRALPMVDRTCDVGALGADLVHWSDDTRVRWAFAWHGAIPPAALGGAATDTPADPAEEIEA